MPQSARDQLLAAAVARAAQGGISEISLRQIATDLGTSHRMLIYHFGTKEGLLAAISGAVEQQQRDALNALRADPSVTPVDAAMRMWQRFADPALWPLERLFFELYVQALQGKQHSAGFLDAALEPWFAPTIETQVARGMPLDEARAWPGSGLPPRADCCWICSPPATAAASMPRCASSSTGTGEPWMNEDLTRVMCDALDVSCDDIEVVGNGALSSAFRVTDLAVASLAAAGSALRALLSIGDDRPIQVTVDRDLASPGSTDPFVPSDGSCRHSGTRSRATIAPPMDGSGCTQTPRTTARQH